MVLHFMNNRATSCYNFYFSSNFVAAGSNVRQSQFGFEHTGFNSFEEVFESLRQFLVFTR